MAGVKIEELSKRFSDGGETVVAVDELDLTIEDGDFVVLVGPSGCGKTTTLRCIAGLETVTEGKIKLEEEVVTGKPPEKRNIAMVFQSYALYPHMTVEENMAFGLKHATDLDKGKIETRIQETANMMGIGDLLDRQPEDLSGGQQQRVALGRAIVRDPAAFLMDEPLSNLDAKLRAEMRTYLQQLQEDIDVTTIYVTHDQTEAMTMGDKIAILDDGRLQQYGTPSECYHEPKNTFVAEFLGEPSINLFRMTYTEGSITSDVIEYEVPSELRDSIPNDEIIAGVRPEALQLTETSNVRDTFEGEVTVVEHLGKETNIYVSAGDGGTEFTVIVDGRPDLSSGDVVSVQMPHDSIHLFDAQSGRVIQNATRRSGDVDFKASASANSTD